MPLKAYLEKLKLANSPVLLDKFTLYRDFLAKKNEVMNLTALKIDEYFEKHFYDSLLLSELHSFQAETLLDIGSGAGFPGLVLALVYPRLKVTLLEPTQKRAKFLNETIKLLELKNVNVIAKRAEDYIKEQRETFDLVTARAVANMRVLLELSAPFVKVDGFLLIMKGQNAHEELQEANNALTLLSLHTVNEQIHFLPSDNAQRINFKIKKHKATNQLYPRNYGQIKKKPL